MLKETTINGQKAMVYSPNETKPLPTIIFYPGVGGTITGQGPASFLSKGWAPAYNVVAIQTSNAYGTPAATAKDIAEVKKVVKVSSVHLTGLSGGMGRIIQYLTATANHGVSSVVLMSYSAAANERDWSKYPATWGLVGDSDRYRNSTMEIVAGVAGTGKPTKLTVYKGGHSGWQTYYDPTWKQDGTNIYDWMVSQAGVIVKPEPEPPKPEPEPEPPKPQPSNRIMLPMKDGGVYVKTWPTAPKPGDTLVIPKGTQQVFLSGFEGSKDNYITIEQEDPAEWGKVANYLFSIENAKYFRIKGVKINGGPDHKGFNLAMGKGTSDYTVEDYSSRYGVNGIKASWNPVAGDPSTYAPNTINNLVFENIHVQDTINEGLYIGNTLAINETTALIPARIKGLILQNVKTERTGWDGVQVAHAEGITLENIEAIDSGLANNPIQSNGVIIGGYTIVDKIDGIKVSGATGGGLTIFGRGKIHAMNVTIDGAKTGIYTDDYADGLMGLPVQELVFENVTVSKSTQDDIEIRNAKGTAKKATFINVKATTVKDATGGWNAPEPPKPEPPKPEPPKPTKILVATVKVYDDGSIEKV